MLYLGALRTYDVQRVSVTSHAFIKRVHVIIISYYIMYVYTFYGHPAAPLI